MKQGEEHIGNRKNKITMEIYIDGLDIKHGPM